MLAWEALGDAPTANKVELHFAPAIGAAVGGGSRAHPRPYPPCCSKEESC
jgi:hypothetical protein